MSMKRTGILIAALAVVTLGACGGGRPDGCVTPEGVVVKAIVEGQKQSGLTLGHASAIKGSEVYYVAARYEIAGDKGEAVWATTALDGASPIRSAEAMSAALTTWPRVDGVDAGSQPVRDALACLG